MAQLFDRDIKTIGKYIQAALREELEDSVVAKFATTTFELSHFLRQLNSTQKMRVVISF